MKSILIYNDIGGVMILRLATEADISVIIELRNDMLRAYEENLPDDLAKSIRNYLEKHIADKSCICALAEIDGRIVSMAMLCCYEDIPDESNLNGKCAKLCSVYTVTEFRRKGYMEKLLSYLLDKAKDEGIKAITTSADRNAMSLYERVGFLTASTVMYIDL